jgi:hypothetical protein
VGKTDIKIIFGHLLATALIALLALWTVQPVRAAIIFQDDTMGDFESQGIILDSLDQATTEIIIQFGATIAETLKWSITNTRFELSDDLDLTNNQLTTARMENVVALPGGGAGLGAGGTGRFVLLTAIDSTAPGCTTFNCNPGTYVWDGTIWELTTNPTTLRTISLAPEYPDAVLQPDGSNNNGSFTAGYDSINLHNYYQWTTSQGTLQDYDVVARIQLPQDFISWDVSNPLTFNYMTSDGISTNNKVDIYLLDTANAVAGLTGNTGLANASWSVYSSSDDLSGGTWTVGSWITIKVRNYALTGKSTQAGEIILKYNGK